MRNCACVFKFARIASRHLVLSAFAFSSAPTQCMYIECRRSPHTVLTQQVISVRYWTRYLSKHADMLLAFMFLFFNTCLVITSRTKFVKLQFPKAQRNV